VSSEVRIALLFPELLGTYGDGGNAVVLAERLRWRDRAAEVVAVSATDPVPDSCDLYLLGGGEDAPQIEAARAIGADGPVHRATERGAVVFAVCAGAQIVGRSFHVSDVEQVDGLGLLDCETTRTGETRAVGELLARAIDHDLPPLTGFENHGSRTRLGPGARPLATVEAGVGNGNGTEGAWSELGRGKVVGTYLHGPALARNPALADLLLSWITGPLEPLDDREIEELRAERLRAVARGNLDGVARRSWRDHLLRRS
jgi:CobQ-like glutamine amidotransferase family enzyme